jgi:hypothetical protein
MNRLRNAYLELHPELAPHFTASAYDDLPGALQTLGIDDAGTRRGVGSSLHLIQTLPGMLTVIVASVAAVIGALAALAIALSPVGMAAAAIVGFVLVVVLLGRWGKQSIGQPSASLAPRFPSPAESRQPLSGSGATDIDPERPGT